MACHSWILVMLAALLCTPLAMGQTWLVKDGQPQAQIVIADAPPRMTQLAAKELQTYIRKISGATLPIVTAPSPEHLAIYVGQSSHTEALGISMQGLEDGAFQMKSGERWFAMVGQDRDFVPQGPWAKSRADLDRFWNEWDQHTGATWGNHIGVDRHRHYSQAMDLWSFDQRGSLNAVYAWLQDLGVRWYMPGELGEIVPGAASIALPQVDRVVKPAFGLRYFHFAFFTFNSREDILWYLRLGLNSHSSALGPALLHSHGMAQVHARPEFRQAHPDYFALWAGKRMADDGGKPCLSSPGLFEQNVRYLRTLLDTYDLPMASVFPADGYAAMCQCPLCEGKGTLQRGWSGSMSDYVWGYVDRVARELLKSHPDRKLTCFAYGTYLQPPTSIERLSPNLVVGIVQGRRLFHDPATRQQQLELRQAWLSKLSSQQLLIWDHYPFTAPGRPSHGIPQYMPHLIAQDLQSLAGNSLGEIIEVMFDNKRHMGLHAPAFNHLNLYVTARLYWDPTQDIDALLDEYYTLFYGPAAAAMKTFVDYCEAHSATLRTDAQTMTQVLTLLEAAQQQAPQGSAYRQRLDELGQYLAPLRELREQLSRPRDDVPEARLTPITLQPGDIQIDGKLDDAAWSQVKRHYGLNELQTGKPPTFRTTFRAFWANDALYLGIRCEDPDTSSLAIGASAHNDPGIWNGDVVEILLETPSHAYYQIAVNPAGAMADLDRISGINADWNAQADVAAHIGQGYWSVELRIPIVDPDGGQLDPLHNVVGRKPTELHPWYFNVCRQRARENGAELSAFSPTGESHFHVVRKFARLYIR